jgi:cyclohexadienyl dehydratase
VTLERQKTGFFSAPYLREGKAAIARCVDQAKYRSMADIDRPEVLVVANPGGTNERFDRARLHAANIVVYPDNLTIFDRQAEGDADVIITDASETRYQQKLHPNVLCAIHPDKPFDFGEKAFWMVPDPALKAFVDQWLHLAKEDGEFDALHGKWFRGRPGGSKSRPWKAGLTQWTCTPPPKPPTCAPPPKPPKCAPPPKPPTWVPPTPPTCPNPPANRAPPP